MSDNKDPLLGGIQTLTSLLNERDKQLSALLEYIQRLEAELSTPLPKGSPEVGIV